MLTASDNPKEQARFEELAVTFGPHFAYGVVMGNMDNREAEAFVVYVSTHDLTEQPLPATLDLYYGIPADPFNEEDLDAI